MGIWFLSYYSSAATTPNYLRERQSSKAQLFLSSRLISRPRQKIDSYLAHHPPKKYCCSYQIVLLQDLCLALFTLLKEEVGGGGGRPSFLILLCTSLSALTHNTHSGFLDTTDTTWPFTKTTAQQQWRSQTNDNFRTTNDEKYVKVNDIKTVEVKIRRF